jgi:hypothetical protein
LIPRRESLVNLTFPAAQRLITAVRSTRNNLETGLAAGVVTTTTYGMIVFMVIATTVIA